MPGSGGGQRSTPGFDLGGVLVLVLVDAGEDFRDGCAAAPRVLAGCAELVRGDPRQQRVGTVETEVGALTFKHVLLPIWVAAYRYRGKSFRFVVNGRTAAVQGERPWSWVKIALLVIVVLAVVLVLTGVFGAEGTASVSYGAGMADVVPAARAPAPIPRTRLGPG